MGSLFCHLANDIMAEVLAAAADWEKRAVPRVFQASLSEMTDFDGWFTRNAVSPTIVSDFPNFMKSETEKQRNSETADEHNEQGAKSIQKDHLRNSGRPKQLECFGRPSPFNSSGITLRLHI
jgi:hypothetical protein